MTTIPDTPVRSADGTVLPIIAALSLCHLLNDLMQSLIQASYPQLKESLQLDFSQIGVVTLVFLGTASLLQPLVGLYTDKRPLPYALPAGMASTGLGLLLLASASSYIAVLIAVAFIGFGSSVFHPESSRITRLAAGRRPGFAQSFFQVGGNIGSSIGPLAAAFIVLPRGQGSIGWFAGVALAGMIVLTLVSRWFATEGMSRAAGAKKRPAQHDLSRAQVRFAIIILIALTFSKFVYMAVFSNYYTFYLIERFGLEVGQSQICLFIFLAAVAVGTILGGPLGDKIGRKRIIWFSILGVFPLSMAVPFLPFIPMVIVSALAGMIMASAFPAIVVYAQELMPNRTGVVAGLFFGLAFGMGALGAAAIGEVIDIKGLDYAYRLCAWLPLIGLLASLLPNIHEHRVKG